MPPQLLSANPLARYLGMRQRLSHAIWGESSPPSDLLPSSVALNQGAGLRYYFPELCQRTDVCEVELPLGADGARFHVNIPTTPTGAVLLVHAGHVTSNYLSDAATWNLGGLSVAAITAGLTVIGLPFWQQFPSDNPILIDGFGQVDEDFSAVEAAGTHPLRFHLGPALTAINYATQVLNATAIHMAGFSGGGHLTGLMAALDKRITQSFEILGSLPEYLRAGYGYGPGGDGNWEYRGTRSWVTYTSGLPAAFETSFPGVFNGFLNHYLLGALEHGRSRTQYVGDEDGQNPVALYHTDLANYAAYIDARARGTHAIVIDPTPASGGADGHYVTDLIIDDIMARLGA